MKLLPALLTVLVLALIGQTIYIPEYCRNQSHGTGQGIIPTDQALTHDYCLASQVRDRNAPVSQWIDTLNYDLVVLGDLIGGLTNEIGGAPQP